MGDGAMALTPKQALFVKEYLIDLNATQAAIRAGYSAKTAYSQGERLLRHVEVAAAIAEANESRVERLEIDADWVLRNAIDLHKRCKSENDRTNERQTLDLIGKHVNVSAFRDRIEHSGPNGGPIQHELHADLDAMDPDRARELIAKYLG